MVQLAHYKLDDNVKDYSLNKYHGTNYGITFVAGKIKNAGNFDSDYFTMPDALRDLIIGSGKVGSLSFFINLDSYTPEGTNAYLFSHEIVGNRFGVRIQDDGKIDFILGDGNSDIVSTTVLALSTWYHIIITWNNGDTEIFVENISEMTSASTNTFSSSSITDMLIGALNTTPTQYLDGRLDDIRFYNHILTSTERTHLNNISDKKYELMIEGTHYFGGLKLWIEQSISDYAREFGLTIKDSTRSIRDIIGDNDDITIDIKGTRVFKGKIETKKPNRDKTLQLAGRDNSLRLQDMLPTRSFSLALSSTIFSTILDEFYPGEFDKDIQTTYILRDKNWQATMTRDIFKELANNDSVIFFVDVLDTFVVRPETFVDSGVHLQDGDIIKEDFKKMTSRIVNSMLIVYGPDLDLGIRRKNASSIKIFKEKQKKFNRREITTLAEATAFADHIMFRYANPIEPLDIEIRLDETLDVGELVTITSSSAGITALQFVILNAKHQLDPPKTQLKIGLFSTHTAEVLQEIIRKLRVLEENEISPTVAIQTVDDTEELLTVTAHLTVEKASESGAEAGQFLAGSRLAGQRDTGFIALINEEKGIITNRGIESINSIVSQLNNQDAVISPLFDGNNSHITAGNGTTTPSITDTVLDNEQVREQLESGYPKHPNPDVAGVLIFQSEIDDGNIFNASFTEFALHNDPSVGEMLVRLKSSSSVLKSGDEKLRLTWKITIAGVNVTSSGKELIRDLIAGFSEDYIDETNSSIEVTNGSDTHREAMFPGTPEFTNTLFNILRYKIQVSNPGEYPSGAVFNTVRLYNKTSGGIIVIDSSIPDVSTIPSELNTVRQIVELTRG